MKMGMNIFVAQVLKLSLQGHYLLWLDAAGRIVTPKLGEFTSSTI